MGKGWLQMDFLSIRFLVFIICTLVLYNCLNDVKKQHICLLAASYVFYAFFDVKFLFLLIALSVWTWYIGKKLYNSNNKRKICILGITVLLAFLVYFKYCNFFIDMCSKSIWGGSKESFEVVMPIGISFYIFQAISYILDVNSKKLEKAYALKEVLLYVGFFPKIMSGPIVKSRDFLPQLNEIHKVNLERVSIAGQRFLVGVFEKIVIADRIRIAVDSVFYTPMVYSGLSLWITVMGYALQIYYDFAGYSNMAIAIAYLFGYEINDNFNLPYLAKTPSEFWKRWHISLSSWFSEYVYIPLGGNRKGKIKNYINLLLVMLISGIWHGSTLNYLIWGLCWGLVSVIHKIILDNLKKREREKSHYVVAAIRSGIMFWGASLLWIPFRVNSFEEVCIILYRMFSLAQGVNYIYIYSLFFWVLMIVVQICAVKINNGNNPWKPLDIRKFSSKMIILVFSIIIICFAYIGDGSFIYAQY